ncbi:hypothetical protein FA13DRAFT_1740713 [Coprinellus micaceus]|uniref:Uncharacterized protein n=1 Tax=Coprinellus micaceus TaxID=71717 RepID=A0A4Y7SL73_COPMI|nr:hypothetical protein FA13DRAFT_1740713 [Coprinellus micaceus]
MNEVVCSCGLGLVLLRSERRARARRLFPASPFRPKRWEDRLPSSGRQFSSPNADAEEIFLPNLLHLRDAERRAKIAGCVYVHRCNSKNVCDSSFQCLVNIGSETRECWWCMHGPLCVLRTIGISTFQCVLYRATGSSSPSRYDLREGGRHQ